MMTFPTNLFTYTSAAASLGALSTFITCNVTLCKSSDFFCYCCCAFFCTFSVTLLPLVGRIKLTAAVASTIRCQRNVTNAANERLPLSGITKEDAGKQCIGERENNVRSRSEDCWLGSAGDWLNKVLLATKPGQNDNNSRLINAFLYFLFVSAAKSHKQDVSIRSRTLHTHTHVQK